MLTRPAVPPYSSTTMAIMVRSRRKSSSSWPAGRLSGTNITLRTKRLTGPSRAAGSSNRQSRSFTYRTPMISSTVLRNTGRRLLPLSTAAAITDRQLAVSSTATMSMRWVMMSPAVTSPRSKMLVIIAFWFSSMRSCSSASSTISYRSSSVTCSVLPRPALAKRRLSGPGSCTPRFAAAQPAARPTRRTSTRAAAPAAKIPAPAGAAAAYTVVSMDLSPFLLCVHIYTTS